MHGAAAPPVRAGCDSTTMLLEAYLLPAGVQHWRALR